MDYKHIMKSFIHFIIGVVIVFICLWAISERAEAYCEQPKDWGEIDPWPYAEKKTGERK